MRFATSSVEFGSEVTDLYFYKGKGSGGGNPLFTPDLTGDGMPNIVLGNSLGGVTIWDDPPNGEVSLHDAPRILSFDDSKRPGLPGDRIMASGDFNGDGSTDLGMSLFIGPDPLEVLVEFGPFEIGRTPLDSAGSFRVAGAAALGAVASLRMAAGDFNGDGVDDLALSSFEVYGREGAVWVFFGPLGPDTVDVSKDADATFRAESPRSWLGTALAAADLDGDGVDNLVVGASMDGAYSPVPRAGLVYVFGDPLPRGELSTKHVEIVIKGEQRGDNAGWSLASCDLDGDGRDGLAVGADTHDFGEDHSNAGRVYWIDELNP